MPYTDTAETLSIVIPCFNERDTIREVLTQIEAVDLGAIKKDVVIVDDGSTDGTREILQSYEDVYTVVYKADNEGKGAALRTGFQHASGTIVIVQDADLEYDPADYVFLIAPIVAGDARVVYGSRVRHPGNTSHSHIIYYLGGKCVTWVTNMLYGSRLTDEPVCYKVFRKEVLDSMTLRCNGFAFCPEVTAQILKQGIHIYEIPVSYTPRRVSEGKKLSWRDGITAIWILIKYRLGR